MIIKIIMKVRIREGSIMSDGSAFWKDIGFRFSFKISKSLHCNPTVFSTVRYYNGGWSTIWHKNLLCHLFSPKIFNQFHTIQKHFISI